MKGQSFGFGFFIAYFKINFLIYWTDQNQMINIGDVFLTKLERNFFGAFKVLKIGKCFFHKGEKNLMIGVLDIIDEQKPQISDERLKKILYCKRFDINAYCIEFFVADEKYNRIRNYEFLGNLPLTDFEKKLRFKLGSGRDGLNEGFPLAGVIEDHFGNTAFLEWRWENEREDFNREVEERRQKVKEFYENRILKPKKMMSDELFWEIISLFNWKKTEDEKIIKPAAEYLSKLKVADIKQFEENLTYKLYCLDTKEHAKNIGEFSYNEADDYVSADFFLYVRCAAIANGREFYENALKNPTQMPKNVDFEILLNLSDTAYEMKTGKEFDGSASNFMLTKIMVMNI